MDKRLITAINKTGGDKTLGGQLVHRGGSMQVSATHAAEARKKGFEIVGENNEISAPPAAPPNSTDPVADLQKKTVPVIETELRTLADDDLLRLEDLEKGSAKPRETLLAAIAKEIERRSENEE